MNISLGERRIMEENSIEKLKLENERLKVSNYILRRENELIMGNIGLICKDKEELLKNLKKKDEKPKKATFKDFLKRIYNRLMRRK